MPDDGEFDHGGGGGGSGSPAAATVAAVVAMDNGWGQKRPATRAPTVAGGCAMTKADSGQQCNNQPTMGAAKVGGGGGGNGDSNGSSNDGNAEILGDPYSKKSPLPSIGNFPCLANSPKLSSY